MLMADLIPGLAQSAAVRGDRSATWQKYEYDVRAGKQAVPELTLLVHPEVFHDSDGAGMFSGERHIGTPPADYHRGPASGMGKS